MVRTTAEAGPGRGWRVTFAALLALAVALTVAACGGGESIEGGSETTEVQTATAEGEASGQLTISNWPF